MLLLTALSKVKVGSKPKNTPGPGRFTTIEQLNILLKQSVSQVVPYQITESSYGTKRKIVIKNILFSIFGFCFGQFYMLQNDIL